MRQKTVLSIAGSDPSGGAGIQADLKTMEAHDVYGMSVITALTAQNTMKVTGIFPVPSDFIRKQLDSVCEDILPDAVKIGMLPDKASMEAVVSAIDKYRLSNIVLDPVLSSTSGTDFSGKQAIEYMKDNLFSRCTVITPNIPEAEILSGNKIGSKEDMLSTAKCLSEKYGCSVLLKGGHSSFENAGTSSDLLFFRAGQKSEFRMASYPDDTELKTEFGKDCYPDDTEVKTGFQKDYYPDDTEVKTEFGKDCNPDDMGSKIEFGKDCNPDDTGSKTEFRKDYYPDDTEVKTEFRKGLHPCDKESDFSKDYAFDDVEQITSDYIWLVGERVENPNTHGTGCTLSSAIACGLAKGLSLENAVIEAKTYIGRCINAGLEIGHGRGPLFHRVGT
ncbi:bifunctional hydroxymethylpyrimidine kinase/phosphomethylpyrimidine kinase [Butyrivibrio sp. JL13D10]|uniref:bifunctional hydroxymethylpyrimidine kinase/phosphomethylpyrimidine kinase n=1 Tax=Butyrivibrio sp. JL13D10 TaxID=3236815 RepID=UPI0038B4A1E7